MYKHSRGRHESEHKQAAQAADDRNGDRHGNNRTPTRRKQPSADANGDRQARQETQTDAVRELIAHSARIQLASLRAASRFFAGWAQAADRYAQALSDELLGRVQGGTTSSELVGRLAAVSSRHLREVTALPGDAVEHFNNELTTKPRSRKRTPKPAHS